eukprot:2216708-Prymnesium_polylepis.1
MPRRARQKGTRSNGLMSATIGSGSIATSSQKPSLNNLGYDRIWAAIGSDSSASRPVTTGPTSR